ARERRRRRDFRTRDFFRVRRLERHHPGWAARLLLDGERRSFVPLARRYSSQVPHAAPGHRPPGGLVIRTRRHRYIPSPFRQSDLYGVDLFRADGDRLVSVAASAWLLPLLSDLGLSRRADVLCGLRCAHRPKPSRLCTVGKLLRPAACRSWLAGLLRLAP